MGEKFLFLPLRPVGQKLRMTGVSFETGLSTERQQPDSGVEIHEMHSDHRFVPMVRAEAVFQQMRQMLGQLRDQHIGIVQKTEVILQRLDGLQSGGETGGKIGHRSVDLLKQLHRVAQTFGRDPHLMQFVDGFGIAEIGREVQHLLQTCPDDQGGVDGEGRIRLQAMNGFSSCHADVSCPCEISRPQPSFLRTLFRVGPWQSRGTAPPDPDVPGARSSRARLSELRHAGSATA